MATKAVSHDRFRLVGAYERLRRNLLESVESAKLDRSLSYWVLATDRRLPIAFLDRRLRELLELELDQLMATPGVGQKKILGFLDLLRRAAKPTPPPEPFGLTSLRSPLPRTAAEAFSASDVSEELWAAWCDTVRRNHLEECPLGRIAPTLQVLPTVIWRKTLGDYVGLSLDELRRLPTHGEKRVAALLEIFCVVHEAISTSVLHANLDLQITPAFVTPLTKWILEVAERKTLPSASEVHARLAAPLIAQIEIDRGANRRHRAESAGARPEGFRETTGGRAGRDPRSGVSTARRMRALPRTPLARRPLAAGPPHRRPLPRRPQRPRTGDGDPRVVLPGAEFVAATGESVKLKLLNLFLPGLQLSERRERGEVIEIEFAQFIQQRVFGGFEEHHL